MLGDILDQKVRTSFTKEWQLQQDAIQKEADEAKKREEQQKQREKEQIIAKETLLLWGELENLFNSASIPALRTFYRITVHGFSEDTDGITYKPSTLVYKYKIESGEDSPWKLICEKQSFKHNYQYPDDDLGKAIELAKTEGIDAERCFSNCTGEEWIFTYRLKTK